MDALVVDDDPTTCMVLHDLLQGEGFTVRYDTSPTSALATLREGYAPQVIVADAVMRGPMDGFGFLEAVRTLPLGGKTPVLLMTGDERALGHAKVLGVPSIFKPFEPEALMAAIQGVLGEPAIR